MAAVVSDWGVLESWPIETHRKPRRSKSQMPLVSAPSLIISVQPPNLLSIDSIRSPCMNVQDHLHHVTHKIVSADALLSAGAEYASRDAYAREEAYPFREINALSLAAAEGFDELVDAIPDDGLEFLDGRAAERAVPGFATLHVLDGIAITNQGRLLRPHISAIVHWERVGECPSLEGKWYVAYWRSWACPVSLARA